MWDSVADVQMIGRFGNTFAKLHAISKPTVAAVQGWCIAGGTDMILNADLIVAGESARFGYPPARVWGVPEAPWVWVARLGLERAKRYLFTGDELTAAEAADVGMILECVPDDELARPRRRASPQRMALLPLNQLQMMKWMLNDVARHQYQPDTSRLLGFIFDGVARHTQEGLDFVTRAQEIGWREAVRERDRPVRRLRRTRLCVARRRDHVDLPAGRPPGGTQLDPGLPRGQADRRAVGQEVLRHRVGRRLDPPADDAHPAGEDPHLALADGLADRQVGSVHVAGVLDELDDDVGRRHLHPGGVDVGRAVLAAGPAQAVPVVRHRHRAPPPKARSTWATGSPTGATPGARYQNSGGGRPASARWASTIGR